MRKLFFFFGVFFCSINFYAIDSEINESFLLNLDSLKKEVGEIKIVQENMFLISSKVEKLELIVNDLQIFTGNLYHSVSYLQKEFIRINSDIQIIDSTLHNNGDQIIANYKELSQNIHNVSENAFTATNRLASDVFVVILVGIMIAFILLLLTLILFYVLKKKTSTSYNKIKEAQKYLEEEGIKLDTKLIELLEKQISVKGVVIEKKSESDHSLALKIADEIVRIETNLSRMDNSIKGYKQLSASVRRIKDNFLSNGYEMVDMLGKPYKEGIKAIVNFETDESLAEDEQIISKIIKPQINYNGVMIQTAQITVSQN